MAMAELARQRVVSTAERARAAARRSRAAGYLRMADILEERAAALEGLDERRPVAGPALSDALARAEHAMDVWNKLEWF
jgi:hypothetical protein